jgi:hypothetical protein
LPSAPANSPANPDDWLALSWDDRDQHAWHAICHWPDHTDLDPVRDGLDYALLTRWFLWDKVGRAIRRMTDPEDYAPEIDLLGWNTKPGIPEFAEERDNKRPLTSRIKSRIKSTLAGDAKRPDIPSGDRVLYVPQPNPRIEQACLSVMETPGVTVFAGQGSTALPDAQTVPDKLKSVRPDDAWPEKLTQAIAEGLDHFGIALHECDVTQLTDQIRIQTNHLKRAEAELKWVQPHALLLHADNHPRPINYVLLCRKLGIPTIMLQHGLDCERYYLDDAYASHIAVWGPERKTRYETHSAWQPQRVDVTGNPEFDTRIPPDALDTSGSCWLWVSRPHAPDKCYAPSRSVVEGLQLLDTLIESLKKHPIQRLIIKPHPYDTIDGYRDCIARHEMGDRIRIEETALENWLPDASLVITEDSTAGLEAMFLGKPLIHAHLAPTPPTMPFGETGAALPGYTPEQLRTALSHAMNLPESSRATMLQAQQRTLLEFAGACDGQSSTRIRDFIVQTLKESTA